MIKKYIVILITIMLLIGLLSGCECKHDWEKATCKHPKTCEKCGEEKGDPLGHTESEWTKDSVDIPKLEITYVKYCQTCHEELDRKTENLDQLHDSQTFIITPELFTERLCSELSRWEQHLESRLHVTANNTAIADDHVTTITTGAQSVGYMVMFKNTERIPSSKRSTEIFDSILVRFSFDSSVEEAFMTTLIALITTCDPSISKEDAKSLLGSLIATYSLNKNGLNYYLAVDEVSIMFSVTIEGSDQSGIQN